MGYLLTDLLEAGTDSEYDLRPGMWSPVPNKRRLEDSVWPFRGAL
jgi:hypothetical protein